MKAEDWVEVDCKAACRCTENGALLRRHEWRTLYNIAYILFALRSADLLAAALHHSWTVYINAMFSFSVICYSKCMYYSLSASNFQLTSNLHVFLLPVSIPPRTRQVTF